MTTRPDRDELLGRFPFELDRFQLEAIDAVDEGRHVVVAAPTGSGKTVVAEYAIAAAVADGRRAFFTAPIKALSNQKFRDLRQVYGADRVGLLTGDTSVNGDAAIVVMTTEVLRNMVYARRNLDDLGVVVVDEVHFLQDAYRGPVWEELIIHLPDHIRLVCLSATVSNARELGEWIEVVRGPTWVVVEERRAVRLDHHYLAADRTTDRLHLLPTIIDGQPNPQAVRLDASAVRFRRGRRHDRGLRGSGRRTLATPGRLETVDLLAQRGLLPAIVFIFSRAQCDAAVQECIAAGLVLTDADERERIRGIVEDRLVELSSDDLDVLGYTRFVTALEAGIAAHHAGMVPAFKEVVEMCFVEGLVKVVFATETLAVGINMPARSVVIEKLTKFTGEHHETLSPAQYTQLTGRAGRRGIDELGTAIVSWSPFVRFDQVAELAQSRSFHLRSAFRPTYNMVANLIDHYDADTARRLLGSSFAQFQADRDVVRLERRRRRLTDQIADADIDATSPFGDLTDYRAALAVGTGSAERHDPVEVAMAQLRPGDLIHVSRGKHHGPCAVVATANRKAGLRVSAITPAGHLLQISAGDFPAPPSAIGSVVLPGQYSPHRKDFRDEVARRITRSKLTRPSPSRRRDEPTPASDQRDLIGTGWHPVEEDPDLAERLAAAERADRLRNELDRLDRRIARRDATLAAQYDAVLSILAERGYVDTAAWRLTEHGTVLTRLFHESDLLVAEAIIAGVFDGLSPAAVAGLASTFVYEHRSPDDPPPVTFPDHDTVRRWRRIESISAELAAEEVAAGISPHRPPEPTFFGVAAAWVSGDGFADVVDADELTGGDFVRTVKQLADLLRQIGQVAPDPATRQAAWQAAEAAYRGVVADSSVVEGA